MTLVQDKETLRSAMLAWRGALGEADRRAAAEGLRAIYLREQLFEAPVIVAGFWPIKEEIDIRPLLIELHNQGCQLALPVVQGKGLPLLFRAWRPGDPLEAGVFGTLQPQSKREAIEPDALLVPLLACDAEGWRLGYGGGFYDRTLFALKSGATFKDVRAIGIAYAGQERASLPKEAHDMALDGILTEQGLRRF
jgi:5-formyltetrahydrofolate cyclo-ligase